MRSANLLLNTPRLIGGIIAIVLLSNGCADQAGNTIDANEADTQDSAATFVDVRLSAISTEKSAAISNNLIDIAGSWHGWTGEQSTIQYDPQTDRLRIAAPADDASISFGVRRFDLPLVAGNWYALDVDADGTEAAAAIFLFDTDGRITPAITDDNGGLMLATESAPLSFSAPPDIAGFYLQVQSAIHTTNPSSLTATITTGNDDNAQLIPDGELISVEHLWPLWNGAPGQVAYEPETHLLRIEPANVGGGNAIGAQRLGFGLEAGSAYQLSALRASDSDASVLLFLFDSQYQVIPFSGDVNRFPWLAASSEHSQSFVAPAGVADIGIQVQSGYESVNPSFLVPSLRAVVNDEPDPAVTPVSPPTRPVPERPVPTPDE